MKTKNIKKNKSEYQHSPTMPERLILKRIYLKENYEERLGQKETFLRNWEMGKSETKISQKAITRDAPGYAKRTIVEDWRVVYVEKVK